MDILLCVKLPPTGSDDIWVLRDGKLRTVSGQECSSTKQTFPGAARVPESSCLSG